MEEQHGSEAGKLKALAHATVMSAILLLFSSWVGVTAADPGAAAHLPVASVHFEQNATDADMEVVFEVKAEDDGLAELFIVSPDGRTVVDFKAPESSTLGIRQFRFESPEPPDVAALKAAYPEGIYLFSGKTSAGNPLQGSSRLSHRLPAASTFIVPVPEAEDVPIKNLDISWRAVESVAFYIIEIEQDELNVNITARLPGSSTSFSVPNDFLVPGTEYEMELGTVTDEGNITFVETSFTTER